ncbi:MAG TPA: diguanylate cyclase [Terriglobia bacterium]|nr:diguanylate cyclase [Terriglobia bacterium]
MSAPAGSIAHLRHELRTPVNHILGFSELLIEEANERNLQSYVPALERIRDGGNELLERIQEALGDRQGDLSELDMTGLMSSLRDRAAEFLGQAEALRNRIVTGHEQTLEEVDVIADALRNLMKFSTDPPETATPTTASKPEPGASEAGEPDETADRARGRIVIADDDKSNREILFRRLLSDGHEPMEAANGLEVLNLLQSQSCDLVLLDILMPELDGFQTLARMKQDPRLRDIPVIMISALDDLSGVVRCIEMGAEDYLPKPFNRVLLQARIGASLEKKRLRDRDLRQTEELQQTLILLESAREKLALQASQDVLTGLANRRSVDTHIDNRMKEATPFSVFYIDLNGFKEINDTYGHQAGDSLLKQVSHRLRLAFRATDLVGRWGGDEFVGIVSSHFGGAHADADRIAACFHEPFIIDTGTGAISARIGAAVGIARWQPGDNIADVLKRADAEMYLQKQEQKQRQTAETELEVPNPAS